MYGIFDEATGQWVSRLTVERVAWTDDATAACRWRTFNVALSAMDLLADAHHRDLATMTIRPL